MTPPTDEFDVDAVAAEPDTEPGGATTWRSKARRQ
jgi:hypothetical protein